MEDTPRYDTGASMEMPRYVSCKQVWALKIARVEVVNLSLRLHFEDPRYAPRMEPTTYGPKDRDPQDLAGGYYVIYRNGHASWSPADVFEREVVPEAEWGLPRSQESKYGVNLRGKLFNRATGEEVVCPVWIGLAKDRRMLPTLLHYRDLVPTHDADTIASQDVSILMFSDFKHAHPELMKDGDSRRPTPPMPFSLAPARRPELEPEKWKPGEREGS